MANSSSGLARKMAGDYLERLTACIAEIQISELEKTVVAIEKTRDNGGTVWICGNGGSAATASHMQVDLSFGVKPAVRARSMSDNAAAITATGNDLAYSQVFARQILLGGNAKDLLIVISASGNSENLLEAVGAAKSVGMPTCAFVGFDGGKLKHQVDLAVHTPTRVGDYGVAEDLHASINHILKEMLNGFWGNGSKA